MGKLSLVWIVLGLIIFALGSHAYMGLIVKKPISEPVTMFLFGICLVSFARLMIGMRKK